MGGYLRGALQGLGKGLAEIGTSQVQSNILEARTKRLAQYSHDLEEPARQAEASRLAANDKRDTAHQESQSDYQQKMISLKEGDQEYTAFKDSVDRVAEASQALDEWYVDQAPVGGKVSPEITTQYNERRVGLRDEYNKIMRSFPTFAKTFAQETTTPPPKPDPSEVVPPVNAGETQQSEPSLNRQHYDKERADRDSMLAAKRAQEIDQILNSASSMLNAPPKPVRRNYGNNPMPDEVTSKSHQMFNTLNQINQDPNASTAQKERAKTLYQQYRQ